MENYGLRQLQELRPSCDGQQQQQRPDVGSVLVVRFFCLCRALLGFRFARLGESPLSGKRHSRVMSILLNNIRSQRHSRSDWCNV